MLYNHFMETDEAIQKYRRDLIKKLLIIIVAFLFIGWLISTPAGLLGKADAIAYAVCHRIDARSFHFGTRQIPLCARCTGMYLGALLGLLFQQFSGNKRIGTPPLRVIVVAVLLVLFFIVDGGNSFLSLFPESFQLYTPQNWIRLFAGTGMGIALSIALFPAFNLTMWKDTQSKPAVSGLKSLSMLLLIAVGVDVLVLTQNPLILYPLALISAGTVLFILSLVYSMVWVMLLRMENQFIYLRQLSLPLLGGFGMALLQIILLDIVRYTLTGTWDGFHIG